MPRPIPPEQFPFLGRMNLDDPPQVVEKGFHTDARNIIWRGADNDMRAEDLPGTRLIPFTLPAGTNVTIGGTYYSLKNKLIYLNYNSNGNHAIYMEDVKAETVQVICNDGAVLNFNPDNPVSSIDVLPGDVTQGDVIYWVNSDGTPSQINIDQAIAGGYGTFRGSYILVIKAPSEMPPYCIYEDNATVTTNNLHKKLFQFKTRRWYNNQDKSVYSARSRTPLPINDGDPQVDADPTKNSCIAIVIQTGPPNVKKLEIAATNSAETTYLDFYQIEVLDKAQLGIPDDDIYIYRFFNDKSYDTIDVPQSIQLQDKVPIQAGAGILLNGNVPAYGDILEGYNPVSMGSSAIGATVEDNRRTQPKVLLVAAQDGQSIGTAGDPIHIIVLGAVTQGDVFNVYTTNNTISYTAGPGDTTTNVINGLATAATGAGFTIISQDANNLYIQKAAEQLIRWLLVPATAILGINDATFAYDWWSREVFGAVYFDGEGRTSGVMVTSGFTTQTLGYSESIANVPQIPLITLSIFNPPPIWADYMHIVRAKNLSKQRILQFISAQTFRDNVASDDGYMYAYISIESLNTYIKDKPAAVFLAYDFAPGDRIRFIKSYPTGGATIPQIYGNDRDYEIQSQVINPVINGAQQTGQFLKIYLPNTDISFDFGIQFHAPALTNIDYSNYFFELYTPAQPASEGLNIYYEFSERYAIGNAGLSTRYHQGMLQNQSTNYVTPATYQFDQGDFYLRYRNINAGVEYKFTAIEGDVAELDFIPFSLDKNFDAVGYTAQPVPPAHLSGNLKDSDNWMVNVTDGLAYTFRVKGSIQINAINGSSQAATISMFSTKPDGTQASIVLATMPAPITAGHQYTFPIDTTYTVAAGFTKLFVMFITPDNNFNAHVVSGTLTLTDTARTFSQILIDMNFSDSFQSAVNSNGRPQAFDPNARQTRFPVLMRFGLAYEVDTNINQSNRFYVQNFDTYDNRFGKIVRFYQFENILRVFQYRKCGAVGVYARWIKQDDGSNQLITSDTIITPNNINYYEGEFGIGNQYMGLAGSGYANYFPDPIKGYLLRLSLDGITPISDLYKVQTWSGVNLPPYLSDYNYQYGGHAKILGAFNIPKDRSGDYMCIAQRGQYNQSVIGGETLVFNEKRNAFTSKYDFAPDLVICGENRLFSWYGGALYVHDNIDAYNTFYGQHFDSVVEVTTKDPRDVKKDYVAISYNSPYQQYNIRVPLWVAPNIGDVETSLGNQSNLVEEDFIFDQGLYHAAIQRAWNTEYGIIEGDFMKGVWLKLRLSNPSTSFTWLSNLYISWLLSQKSL